MAKIKKKTKMNDKEKAEKFDQTSYVRPDQIIDQAVDQIGSRETRLVTKRKSQKRHRVAHLRVPSTLNGAGGRECPYSIDRPITQNQTRSRLQLNQNEWVQVQEINNMKGSNQEN